MRQGPPAEVLTGAYGWSCRVSSWLGDQLLAATVPITSGRLVAQTSQQVPERVTLTVPRRADGVDWRPGSQPDHPLARYGQELIITGTVTSVVSGQEWPVQLGRYLITDWSDDDDGSIAVTAAGRLRRVADARLTSPTQPGGGATLRSEMRRLLPSGMSAVIAAGLVDRACPASMAWSDDRLAAIQEIADAWPALLRTDEWGQVALRPPLPAVPVPVIWIRDGERGTLLSATRSDTREGAYNQVVARSSATDREDIQAVASQTAGPMAVTGEYGEVTRLWSSPLIESQAMAQASAETMLANSILPATSIPVRCPPDPRIDLDDPVEVVRGQERTWGWVTGYDLPLTVADGDMRVDVGVQS